MPFIDLKLSKKIDEKKKEAVKNRIGESISILGKPESYLMVGINDSYNLYFASKPLDNGAYVDVKLFGGVDSTKSNNFTKAITKILNEELGISGSNIYVAYFGTNNWGFNGSNF